MGSGSGLPAVLIALLNPSIPGEHARYPSVLIALLVVAVFAVESKSRKTGFLDTQATHFPNLQVVKADINQISRVSSFDVSYVTAKAFKPLGQVIGIASRAIHSKATLLVPISSNQIAIGSNEGLINANHDILWLSGFSYYSRMLHREGAKSGRKKLKHVVKMSKSF